MELKRLQLEDLHKSLRAQMVPFAGWEMPVVYSSIAEEHMAVREAAGLFDISHMGEILIRGKDAMSFLQWMTTNDVSKLSAEGVVGAQYSTALNERGGIRDDIFVYMLERNKYMVVANAVNTEKIYNWFVEHRRGDVEISDITMTTVMLALQGPKAIEVLQKLTSFDLSSIKRFNAAWVEFNGTRVLASRTGYTGEDGFELYLLNETRSNPKRAEKLWSDILRAGEAFSVKPCGLGARDTTRLEAGLVLYGNDIDENITPLEAKIGFVVKFEKGDFIGREALLAQKAAGVSKTRVGMRMLDRGIPRHGYKVLRGGKEIGVVTSGTLSPLLNVGIAMGYVPPEVKVGDKLQIEIHGKPREAEVVSLPFYDPNKYGYARKKDD
jgi:aminomethyltransferase